MRHRTLLTGLLFICSILTATTAFAIPTLQFSIEDSTQPTPNSIGIVISVSTEFDVGSLVDPNIPDVPRHVMTLLPIAKVPLPQTAADWWKPGLRIHPDEIPARGAIFFTSADCSGTPWIGEFQIDGEFDPTFDPHVVIRDSLISDVRTLYAADPAAPLSAPMDFNSLIGALSDGCLPIIRNMQAKPAILLVPDLHQVFPPPYKLNFVYVP